MSPGKRKILLGIIGILFGIFAGFLLCEILLRILAPQWLVVRMKELNLARNAASFGSDVGWSVESIDGKFVKFVPNTHFPVRYYEYNNTAHIDRFGGRAIAEVAKKDHEPVIPFLGDSFPFGIGVEDKQTYVSLLNSKSRYRFINLAIPGSALPNQLDQIQFRHSELHSPKVYVFSFYTGNDYVDIVKYYSRTNVSKPGQQEPSKFIQWLDQSVYHNRMLGKSFVLQFIKHTLLRDSFDPKPSEKPAPVLRSCMAPVRGKPPVTNGALMIMAGRQKCINEIEPYVKLAVDHLQQLAQEQNFSPIFLIIPDKIQVLPALLEKRAAKLGMKAEDLDPQLASKVIEKQLDSHGIPYIDLASCLKESGLYYKIDDHFTPAGHRAVADCAGNKLDAMISSLL